MESVKRPDLTLDQFRDVDELLEQLDDIDRQTMLGAITQRAAKVEAIVDWLQCRAATVKSITANLKV